MEIVTFVEGTWRLSQYSEPLHAGSSGDRIPAGAKFFAPVYRGPGAHPSSSAMSTEALSRG